MNAQCFLINLNRASMHNASSSNEPRPSATKEKLMSYEEKTVGSTPFFKCEACPYMALAEDDIKFHLFTVHPDLAKSNGLADNIQIPCPGCTSIFDAEETLRTHLRNHHKMGIKDIKKMIKSLVQIALKNAKLKKEDKASETPPPVSTQPVATDIKMPQVIEIIPDTVNADNHLPKGVAFISVDELNKMSTPNFEKVDPKEIIQEASINIVYTNEVSTQYVNLSDASASSANHNVVQVSSIPPDLITSVQPRLTADNTNITSPKTREDATPVSERPPEASDNRLKDVKETGKSCPLCPIHLKDENNQAYHKKCHQNGHLVCPECKRVFVTVDALHSHLWKIHSIDLELPTCEVCGFKTFKKYRLFNVHMKCHENVKSCICPICSKAFKNYNQLSKHKQIHRQENKQCVVCKLEFSTARRMEQHMAAVHEKLKPFKCSHCDYTAARKSQMVLHIRSHTGVKPYACSSCDYRSADHNALRRHKKLHSKESLYQCKYCPYSAIQSTAFAGHMLAKHPNDSSKDLHQCRYCPFKTINNEKFIMHLSTHTDKNELQLLLDRKNGKSNKPSWTIPSNAEPEKSATQDPPPSEQSSETNSIEVYDCDSISESLPQNYSKSYCNTSNNDDQQQDFNAQVIMTDLSKDDNNSDCLISESSNHTMMERHQFPSQHPLQMTYDNTQPNLHFLNPSVSMEPPLLQNSNVNSLATSHSSMGNNCNKILSNFPIRLPPAPQISVRNNIMLKPVDKLSLPLSKVTGPIITPTQILPVPSSSNSPVSIQMEPEGVPRKKPKISVKSNLILKGPDQENMFHSQQKMAFKRLEDNERFGLGSPMTFNNLITTQFMLQPEPALSESPNDMMSYTEDNMLGDSASTPVGSEMSDNSQIFSFSQQMNVNTITLLPPPEKIPTSDPSYIKLEATIKQNTQSPSLERMCNANILSSQAISREYKASPPLEDIHKNMSEIKNEMKSDAFYNMPLNNTAANPSILDQYLMDNIIGGHMDLSSVVLPEVSDDQQNDVIEIDDNSDDNKLLPRFDMNFLQPLESMYVMHNDFHFLENDLPPNNIPTEVAVSEMNRVVTEIPIINQKENLEIVTSESSNNDFQNFIQGKKDPMMNTSVRPSTNKINVKNIELMKN